MSDCVCLFWTSMENERCLYFFSFWNVHNVRNCMDFLNWSWNTSLFSRDYNTLLGEVLQSQWACGSGCFCGISTCMHCVGMVCCAFLPISCPTQVWKIISGNLRTSTDYKPTVHRYRDSTKLTSRQSMTLSQGLRSFVWHTPSVLCFLLACSLFLLHPSKSNLQSCLFIASPFLVNC